MQPDILKNIFSLFTNSFIELIYPTHCYVCGERLADEKFQFVCQQCFYSMPIAEESSVIINEIAKIHGFDNLHFINAYCLFKSNDDYPFEKLIYALKYNGIKQIGIEFGKILGQLIKNKSYTKYDYIIPVPIHKAKERERGYNQSFYIAKAVAEVLETKLNNKVVKRIKYTDTQTKLDAGERINNVRNIFQVIDRTSINNKNLLIVDDVLTTGSTMNSLAEILLEEGARQVDVATLMRA